MSVVHEWTKEDVADWLEASGLSGLADAVDGEAPRGSLAGLEGADLNSLSCHAEHCIDGEALLLLDNEALRDIGISKVGSEHSPEVLSRRSQLTWLTARLRLLRLIGEIADLGRQADGVYRHVGPDTMIRLQEEGPRNETLVRSGKC